MKIIKLTIALSAAGTLAACSFEGTRAYQGPTDYIAIAGDVGQSTNGNLNDNAGIAVTPDGCQAWIIDDGIEGRASNRLDPVSGLPVCGGEPGAVYGNYQSGESEIKDEVPGEPGQIRVENVPVRSVNGQFMTVHPESQVHH